MNKEVLKNRAELCAVMPLFVVLNLVALLMDIVKGLFVGIWDIAVEMVYTTVEHLTWFRNATRRVWNWKPENEVKK